MYRIEPSPRETTPHDHEVSESREKSSKIKRENPLPKMPFLRRKIKAILKDGKLPEGKYTHVTNIKNLLEKVGLNLTIKQIIDASHSNKGAESELVRIRKTRKYIGMLDIPQDLNEEAARKIKLELAKMKPDKKNLVFAFKQTYLKDGKRFHTISVYS